MMMTTMMAARYSRRPPAGPADDDGGSSVQFVGARLVGDIAHSQARDDDGGDSAQDGESTVPGEPNAYVQRSGASIDEACDELFGELFSQAEVDQLRAVGAIPGASAGPGTPDGPPPESGGEYASQLPDRHDTLASIMRAQEGGGAAARQDSDDEPLSQVCGAGASPRNSQRPRWKSGTLDRTEGVEAADAEPEDDDVPLATRRMKKRSGGPRRAMHVGGARKRRKVRDARGNCQRGCPRPRTCCHRGRSGASVCCCFFCGSELRGSWVVHWPGPRVLGF